MDALRRLGGRTVERAGQRYVATFPAPEDLEAFLGEARLAVRASTSVADPWLRWEWRSDHEWSQQWQEAFEERRIGERVVVAPAGTGSERAHQEGDDVVLRLCPAAAFGTGEHATTRACLIFLERLLESGQRVADIGAGSGILSIAAALLGAGWVTALEADPYACTIARENAAVNGVDGRVVVREGWVDAATLRGMAPFDGILANIEAQALIGLLPSLARALPPTGWLVLSGILVPERERMLLAADAAGLELDGEREEEGWWTGSLRVADGRADRDERELTTEARRTQRGHRDT